MDLNAAIDFIENGAHFISANDDNSVPYFAHCVSRTGSYLSKTAGIKEGEALAYLVAPPLEAMYGIDAALKAADVKVTFYLHHQLKLTLVEAYLLEANQLAKQLVMHLQQL